MITEFLITAFLYMAKTVFAIIGLLLPNSFILDEFPAAFTLIFTPVLFFDGVLPLNTLFSLITYLFAMELFIFTVASFMWFVRKIPGVS